VTSTSWKASSVRAAFSGVAVSRSSSFHQACCTGVPPGMNWLVKTL
jgi:hypothetical protein